MIQAAILVEWHARMRPCALMTAKLGVDVFSLSIYRIMISASYSGMLYCQNARVELSKSFCRAFVKM